MKRIKKLIIVIGVTIIGLLVALVMFGMLLEALETPQQRAARLAKREQREQREKTEESNDIIKPNNDKYGDKTQQALWIARSQDAIKNRLKDPDSAKFRNVYFSDSSGKPMVCGGVNSKNALGGYAGYQRFVAAGEVIAVLETEVSDFGNLWKKVCRR